LGKAAVGCCFSFLAQAMKKLNELRITVKLKNNNIMRKYSHPNCRLITQDLLALLE
jgi:hypothetical protein